MNIECNNVFVSLLCKVNLSAQLLYVVMVKKCSSEIGGTQLQKKSRSVAQKAKGWEPLLLPMRLEEIRGLVTNEKALHDYERSFLLLRTAMKTFIYVEVGTITSITCGKLEIK